MAEGLSLLHQVMSRRVGARELPGLATGVSYQDQLYADVIGTTALDGSVPMARDSIFRISSMTKLVIAAAVMTLVEKCVLRLNDPVAQWLPELANPQVVRSLEGPIDDTVPANRAITVRDLLTYTAGYGVVFAMPGTYPAQDALAEATGEIGPPMPFPEPSMDVWVERLAKVPLLHQPGEQWTYNTSADILGVLIQRASGIRLESYLRESIFDPLGMADTTFTLPPESVSRLTASYLTKPDGTLAVFDPAAGSAWTSAPGMPLGSAGLLSTLDDMLAFGRMMLRSGKADGHRILSRPSVELMTTDQLTPAQKAATLSSPGFFDMYSWGLGIGLITGRRSFLSPGAFGWDGGLGTSMWVDPAEDLIGVLLTQQAWPSATMPPLCEDFWAATYVAIGG
jgi:CubicO group peptidase (beta-lactamase class C family)